MTTESILKPLLHHRGGFSFLLFLLIGLWLTGCGPASPRFAGKESSKKEVKKEKHSSVRFSSKEAEEETNEDDRKVDLQSAQQRFAAAAPRSSSVPEKENVKPNAGEIAPAGGFEKQKMMDAILGWIGTPYELGGESKSGIDCSAFSREIFRTSGGMELPRTTEQQVKLGSPIAQDQIQFGDLVFFNTTGNNPSHVGIYIGDDMFAHASVSFGVTLSSMYSSYYKKRFTEARRVLN